MGAAATAILALVLAQLVLAQYAPRPVPSRQPVNPHAQSVDAVATFAGTFKSADKKFLTVEVEDGQVMRMYITGATKFIRDDKNVKASDFHNGDDVTVEASYDLRLNLLADRVIAGKPAKKPESHPDPAPPDQAHPDHTN